jgi:RND superfamily putative drug exporter
MTVLTLAPAFLVLAGLGGWWVPRWMDRILPHVDIEGAHAAEAAHTAEEAAEAPARATS